MDSANSLTKQLWSLDMKGQTDVQLSSNGVWSSHPDYCRLKQHVSSACAQKKLFGVIIVLYSVFYKDHFQTIMKQVSKAVEDLIKQKKFLKVYLAAIQQQPYGRNAVITQNFTSCRQTFRRRLQANPRNAFQILDNREDYVDGIQLVEQLAWIDADVPQHASKVLFYCVQKDAFNSPSEIATNLQYVCRTCDIDTVKMLKFSHTTENVANRLSQLLGRDVFDHQKMNGRRITFLDATIQQHIEDSSIMTSTELKRSLIDSKLGKFVEREQNNIAYGQVEWKSLQIYSMLQHTVLVEQLNRESIIQLLKQNIILPFQTCEVCAKINPAPFNKGGSERYPFYGQVGSFPKGYTAHVIKRYKQARAKNNWAKYVQAAERQAIAAYLAEEFNYEVSKLVHKEAAKLKYIETCALRTEDKDPLCVNAELYQEGQMRKFNNNQGFVLRRGDPILQAFSHWTYVHMDKQLMVVDVQGFKENNTYYLTDPAIHCTYGDILRLGETNYGRNGFVDFFDSHRCSAYCKALLNHEDFIN